MTFNPLAYPPSTRLGTPPNHTPLGQRLEARTDPIAPEDQTYGYAHAHLAEALSRGLIQLQEIFDPDDGSPPFSPLLDPARCPAWALPWLAQLVGVAIPATATEQQAREIIVGLAGHKRGTTAMLEAAAGFYLTGTKTVFFRERDPDSPDPPYTLEVVTLDDETPDPDAVRAALMAQKPAGIILNYRQVQGQDWQQVVTENATWNTVVSRYATWNDLVERTPHA
jgi:hypothetical protein